LVNRYGRQSHEGDGGSNQKEERSSRTRPRQRLALRAVGFVILDFEIG
jgi:hypothetical protein